MASMAGYKCRGFTMTLQALSTHVKGLAEVPAWAHVPYCCLPHDLQTHQPSVVSSAGC